MDESLLVGMLFGALGALALNVGKGVQKWKIMVLGKGWAMFSAPYRRDFFIWLIGMGMTTSANVFFAIALKYTDKTSLVSAMNGLGLIGLVIFAWLVIKEHIGWRELGGAGLVILGITIMGYFDKPLGGSQVYSASNFTISLIILLIIFTPLVVFSLYTKRLHGFTFGALAGSLIGVAMILADMGLVKSGESISGMLTNQYAYLALISATVALALTQLAFWRSTAMIVVPTINSFLVFAPVVIEYFTFGTMLLPIQYLAVLVIIAGIILLTASGGKT